MSNLTDTQLTAERIQIEAIRKMSVGRRMALMRQLTAGTHQRAITALRRARPNLDDEALLLWFIELNYGKNLACKVDARLKRDNIHARI